VAESCAHHDELRVGDDAAGVREVVGERRAQLGPPARVAVAEARGGRVAEPAPQRARPRTAREGGQVREARVEREARRARAPVRRAGARGGHDGHVAHPRPRAVPRFEYRRVGVGTALAPAPEVEQAVASSA
jgi:hypothetical protein